jgi:Bacteriophage lambda head decoration protein D
MPGNDSVEFDYVPGYTKPTHEYGTPYGDEFHAEAVEELLLSTAGYTQRGVTLAAGQGVLPTGCIIARHTASGKYFAYQSGASDGRQIALGVLRDSRDTGGPGATTLANYNANLANVNPDAITLAGGAIAFPASPAGKVSTDCLGNMVIRGILNANVVSGTDTASLIPNTQGLGSAAGAAVPTLGARIVPFGGGIGTPQFPGGPMDGNPTGGPTGVNAFMF